MFFRAVSAFVFPCVFWLDSASFFLFVPRCFRSARKRPTGAIHCKNHMMFMFFQGALSHRRGQQGKENATQNQPKTAPEKRREPLFFRDFFKGAEKRPKKLEKELPGRPKCPPGARREGPGAAQEAPRRPQEPPGAPQERPKSRPRGEKKEQKGNQLSILLVGGLRQASGSHFRAILEPPGWHVGAIFD